MEHHSPGRLTLYFFRRVWFLDSMQRAGIPAGGIEPFAELQTSCEISVKRKD